jgi:hypothetical protein
MGDSPFPFYRSHKLVQAAKIVTVEEDESGAGRIFCEELGATPLSVSVEYMQKHKPQPGGYWVRYGDGYESWSPAEAFEGGYTKV